MKTSKTHGLSRRRFLAYAATAPFLVRYHQLAAADKKKVKIRDVQVMVLQGDRTYTLIKIVSDDGLYGVAEAYGTPAVGVKEQVLSLKPWLVGKDPLEIDKLYVTMGEGTAQLSGTRTDGSAHNMMRAVSGIEMALWDLAGKVLGTTTTTLLGGKFRDRVRVYDHSGPGNSLDKAVCKQWAERLKAHPSGFTGHKFGIPRTPNDDARDPSNRVLTPKALVNIRQGFENCREACGWDHDIMVHCHWEYDVRTAIQLADAVESSRPLWLEDPLIVDYSDSWKRLCASSKVPILMGENLTRREGFKDFVINGGCDIINPDLRNSGGFLETRRIADLAHIYGIPMCNHNTGCQVHTYAAAQFAGAIRDYMALETITGEGGWMDQVLLLDGPYIKNGYIEVNDAKAGLGIELNPDVVKAHLAPGESWWG
jgi:L-alanine-DL-glutamate epimerase-like enolase superfamily enzyme